MVNCLLDLMTKRHELLHQGIKNFKCEGYLQDGTRWGCGKLFARADALRRHFQTEAGNNVLNDYY